ncbi:MAG: glycosyltransferase [Candidatus Paceibacteria bacterium]
MDTLIISVSIGSGHTKAGEALAKRLEKQGQHVEHIDFLNFVPGLIKQSLRGSYNFLTYRTPSIWKFLFDASNNQLSSKITNELSSIALGATTFKLKQYIEDNSPDKIICTHFFPPPVILNHFNLDIETCTLITDYGAHQVWTHPNISKYFVAAKTTKQQLTRLGAPKEKIEVTGIPTDPKFEQKEPKDEILNKINLPEQKTILILSGGQGLAQIDNIIKKLLKIKQSYNLVAVAGKNSSLERKIKNIKSPDHIHYKPLGWTDKIAQYMKVSEMVISKPGGMTTAECIKTKTPLLAFSPIPGQEELNAEYIIENNHGWLAKNEEDVMEKTKEVLG